MKKKKRLSELTMQDFAGYVIPGIEEPYVKQVMTAKDYKRFCKWMGGQTMGMTLGGHPVVYLCDLERFLKRLPVID